jgi:predicted DNA-binding transcriptional regulator AlpA
MAGTVKVIKTTDDRQSKSAEAGDLGIAAEEMWTVNDLEAMLKIDRKTIYGYVQRGLIPYVRIQSNVRFRKESIRQWIQRHSFGPKS